MLKVKAQLSREGRRVFVYEHAKSGDVFQIEDPELQLDQLEAVQHEVLHLLQHGLDRGAPDVSAPPDAAAQVEPAGALEQVPTGMAGVA